MPLFLSYNTMLRRNIISIQPVLHLVLSEIYEKLLETRTMHNAVLSSSTAVARESIMRYTFAVDVVVSNGRALDTPIHPY